MKQTAVEWLANELLHLDNEFDMNLIDKNEYQKRRKQIVEQAKAMEKEQKEKFWTNEEVLRIIQECKSYLSFGDEFNEFEWFNKFKK